MTDDMAAAAYEHDLHCCSKPTTIDPFLISTDQNQEQHLICFGCLCSKRRFANQQAEEWWKENKERVFKKYNHPGTDNAAAGSSNDRGKPF